MKTGSMNLSLFPPESTWTPPREFPLLGDDTSLGLDIETRDDNLSELGPGSIRGDGYVAGVSVYSPKQDKAWYFPMCHAMGMNMDKTTVYKWLQEQVFVNGKTIYGANLGGYDLEWLRAEGIEPKGRFIDVQVTEPLIDEESEVGYSLEALSLKHLGYGKDETLLRQAATEYDVDPKSELWKLPAKYVGKYAEIDAKNPVLIAAKQEVIITAEELHDVFILEQGLIPLLLDMRFKGIPVDLEAATKLSAKFLKQEEKAIMALKKEAGQEIDVWSSHHLVVLAEKFKVQYPITTKGNPSFTKDWLKNNTHPIMKMVNDVRQLNRHRTVFIDKFIFGNQVNGRIHPQFHQLRDDEYGTRTGRFSASHPNPQQVPKRNKALAKAIRSLFIPEPGKKWAKFDYKQQEPRITVHYAYLMACTGAAEFRQQWLDDPDMDFYEPIIADTGAERRDAKDMGLGRTYGMGIKEMARRLNSTIEVAKEKLGNFDRAAPFIKELSDICMNTAKNRGYIKTFLGRRRRFNLYEPVDAHKRREKGEFVDPCPYEVAVKHWPRIQRAGCHKGLNALIQGTAADQMKMGMLEQYEMGWVPHLTMHDETGHSVSTEGEALEMKKVAEECIQFTLPMRIDMEIGDSWTI